LQLQAFFFCFFVFLFTLSIRNPNQPPVQHSIGPVVALKKMYFHYDRTHFTLLFINSGAIGAVVAHEMTHAYDDQGAKYDSKGQLRDWWTESDKTEYEKRTQVMVDQAENFKVGGTAVKGKLCCGENIAVR
jgi:predicted metalloendopeptidase